MPSGPHPARPAPGFAQEQTSAVAHARQHAAARLRRVGRGSTLDLPAGEHTVTVTAPDGLGGTLSERAIIVVGGRSR